MNYRNKIEKKKTIETMVNEVKGTVKEASSFIKNTVNTVSEAYNTKREESIKKSIYAIIIDKLDSMIVSKVPTMEKPIVVTKDNVVSTYECEFLVALALADYVPFEDNKEYSKVVYDVLKLHCSKEPQLVVEECEDTFKVYIKDEFVTADAPTEVKADVEESVVDDVQEDETVVADTELIAEETPIDEEETVEDREE